MMEPATNGDHVFKQGIEGQGAPIGQEAFGVGPDGLIGIEFGGIGGKLVHVETPTPVLQRAHGRPFVDGALIPDDDDGTTQVTQQRAEKDRDLVGREVLRMDMHVQPEALPARADRQGGDGRDLVASVPVPNDWRLGAGRPGAPHGRDQLKPRFIGENEVGVQATGFFLIRGQTWVFQ